MPYNHGLVHSIVHSTISSNLKYDIIYKQLEGLYGKKLRCTIREINIGKNSGYNSTIFVVRIHITLCGKQKEDGHLYERAVVVDRIRNVQHLQCDFSRAVSDGGQMCLENLLGTGFSAELPWEVL